MRYIFLIVLASFLSSCATATTQNYEKILNYWVGNEVDSLVLSWGPPDSIYDKSDGGKVFSYVRQGSITMPGYTTYQNVTTYNSGNVNVYNNYGGSAYANYQGTATTSVPVYRQGYNIATYCKTIFDILANGTVQDWKWEGNNCVAHDPGFLGGSRVFNPKGLDKNIIRPSEPIVTEQERNKAIASGNIKEYSNPTTRTAKNGFDIQKSPSMASGLVSKVQSGEDFNIFGECGVWYMVKKGSDSGYVWRGSID